MFVLLITAFFIPYNVQAQDYQLFRQEGIASWYGKEFDGRPTASGEIYDSSQLTAAHPTLPFGTRVTVTNRHNNRKVTLRVNDRGPFVAARVIDVSRAAAEQLDMIITGTAPVLVESIDRIAVPSSHNPVTTVEPARTPPAPVTQAPPPVVVTPPPVTISPVTQAPPVAEIPPPRVEPPPVPVVIQTPPPHDTQPIPEDRHVPPQVIQTPVHLKLTPEITVVPNKVYRLQIGSYESTRNAVEVFDRLKNAELDPKYERHEDTQKGKLYYRVVLAGVRGIDVKSVTERLGYAGFSEALIREEH